jgi:hypothetical protein
VKIPEPTAFNSVLIFLVVGSVTAFAFGEAHMPFSFKFLTLYLAIDCMGTGIIYMILGILSIATREPKTA